MSRDKISAEKVKKRNREIEIAREGKGREGKRKREIKKKRVGKKERS